jgi:2-C-methyl-D-erythritol 4-phosphate cytidylyltransferase
MTVALIVAAGSGERLGAGRPKALVELGGRPLLQWSIDALREVASIEHIVVALPAGLGAPAGAIALEGLTAVEGVIAVEGGAVRSDSVRRALAAAPEGDPVLVHDAARPLLTPQIAERVIAALVGDSNASAAIAAAPITDTVKRADAAGVVQGTLDRSELWAVQTPQVFRRAALVRALEVHVDELAQATDDASLIERQGGRVIVVPTSAENLKVTTTHDLRLAELLLAARSRGASERPS